MVRPHVHEDGWLGVETTQLGIENQMEESICVSSLCSWVQNLFLASHLHIVKPSKRPRESCSHRGSISLRFVLFGSPLLSDAVSSERVSFPCFCTVSAPDFNAVMFKIHHNEFGSRMSACFSACF